MPISIRYPKLRPYGSVTRPAPRSFATPPPPRNRRIPAGFLVAFYDETGRWLGQLPGDTVDHAKQLATDRGIRFDSFVAQKC